MRAVANHRALTKAIREIDPSAIIRLGYSRGGHCWVTVNGSGRVFFSKTPSDKRWLANTLGVLRYKGAFGD